jgi:hypothetical protein
MGEPWDFLDAENWRGGHYELAIKVGSRRAAGATERVVGVLRTVWAQPGLDGCFRDRSSATTDQERTAPDPRDLDHSDTFYGVAELPDGRRVVCASFYFRGDADDGEDWVDLCLPLGALSRTDRRIGAYPFGDEASSRAWREPIDHWFIRIAEAVAVEHPFELALIGHEVSDQDERFDGGPADGEWVTYLVPSSTGLNVLPPKSWTDAATPQSRP